jgi:hypothetical protein
VDAPNDHRPTRIQPASEPAARATVEVPDEVPIGVTAVARYLGVSSTTTKTYAARAHDPLPLFRIGHRYKCYPSDLRAWVARESERNAASDRAAWRQRRKGPDYRDR